MEMNEIYTVLFACVDAIVVHIFLVTADKIYLFQSVFRVYGGRNTLTVNNNYSNILTHAGSFVLF